MTRHVCGRPGWSWWGFALLLAAIAAGCGGSRWMRPTVPPEQITASSDEATVVFMRPSGYGRKARMMVVDGEGHYLGDPRGKQYFVLRLKPGHHTFVGWAENAEMVQADLAAGRVYYVLLSIRMGIWTARMSLSKLTPEREEWVNLQRWLTDSKQMTPDPAAAQDWVDAHRDDIASRIETARKVFEGLSPDKRALRVIAPEEGELVAGAPPTVPASPEPTSGGAAPGEASAAEPAPAAAAPADNEQAREAPSAAEASPDVPHP